MFQFIQTLLSIFYGSVYYNDFRVLSKLKKKNKELFNVHLHNFIYFYFYFYLYFSFTIKKLQLQNTDILIMYFKASKTHVFCPILRAFSIQVSIFTLGSMASLCLMKRSGSISTFSEFSFSTLFPPLNSV